MHSLRLVFFLVVGIGLTPPLHADVPTLVNFQGLLLDANGEPANAITSVAFAIWSDPNSTDSGTHLLYKETHLSVRAVDGVFSVLIGSGDNQSGPFDETLFLAADRWLEVSIDDQTLSPRQRMTTVPFAFQCAAAASASDADTLDGQDSSAFSLRVHGHDWRELSNIPRDLADGDDDTLGALRCLRSQIPKWDGTSWLCDTDLDTDSGGDITSVVAGLGLSGGGLTGAVSVSADTGYLQRRVSSTCTSGSSIRAISSTGTVTCEPDSGVLSASAPLQVAGTVVSVQSNSITAAQLAPSSVGTSEILNGTITNTDVASSAAITPGKILGTAATLSFSSQSFDGGLVLMNGATNRVGINTTIPSRTLDVNGTTRSDDYEFRGFKTYYHYLRPNIFFASTSNSNWIHIASTFPYAYTSNQSLAASYATLNLPDGVTPDTLTCYYTDDDPIYELADFDIFLVVTNINSGTATTIGFFEGNPANFNDSIVRSISATIFGSTGRPVDNQNYQYQVSVGWNILNSAAPGSNSLLRFHGCRVQYGMLEIAFP